jgi:pimeloyl-ACP methyl ester carboxylesterase
MFGRSLRSLGSFGSMVMALAASAAASGGCERAGAPPVIEASVRDQPVTFRNGEISLSGTLFLPTDNGRRPAVVLFHGSGPEPRNEFMGHWFAEHGIAALTYDKRGVGGSTGDFRTVPFTDLAADGLAAVALLKARPDIDPKRIGVWGLSQGGWLGPLAASESRDVAFVIAVSGPGVSPGEQMVFYYGAELRAQGFSDAEVAEAGDARRKAWHFLSTGEDYAEARHALEDARSHRWFAAAAGQADGLFSRPAGALLDDPAIRARTWFRHEVDYDPKVALRALSVPALFIFGGKDQVVPVEPSVAIIRETLTNAGHHAFSIVVFPDADHGLSVTSADGRGTLAGGYLDAIDEWLRKTLRS